MTVTTINLESLILDRVNEHNIRNLFLEEKINEINEIKKAELASKYYELYPEDEEFILYDKIEKIIVDEVNEYGEVIQAEKEIKHYLPEYYVEKDDEELNEKIANMDEEEIINLDGVDLKAKVLSDDALKLISIGKEAPTLDLFISESIEEVQIIDLENDPEIINEYIAKIQPALKKLLAKLQEVKFTEAEKYVSQNLELSDAMLRSYTLKKDLAKEAIESKDFSLFTVEAASRGITPEELANEILKVNKKWTTELGKLNDMIEGFRAGANKVIDKIDSLEMLDNVMNAFDIAFKLDASAKPEDIIALYEPFEEEK